MFHKRLMQEFRDNMKYVAGMVATQWLMLIANVFFMYTLAGIHQQCGRRHGKDSRFAEDFYCAGMCYCSACGKHLCQ